MVLVALVDTPGTSGALGTVSVYSTHWRTGYQWWCWHSDCLLLTYWVPVVLLALWVLAALTDTPGTSGDFGTLSACCTHWHPWYQWWCCHSECLLHSLSPWVPVVMLAIWVLAALTDIAGTSMSMTMVDKWLGCYPQNGKRVSLSPARGAMSFIAIRTG